MIRATMLALAMAGAMTGLPGTAGAQVLTGDQVKPLLFPVTGASVEIVPQPFIPKAQEALLAQVGAQQPYYGAIAVSPDEGIMVEATVAAANHHSTEAATKAALASCDAKRKGKQPCVVAALIRPTGWKPRPFQLSSGATAGFLEEYQRIRRGKAFAASPSTGLWGVGKGADAAARAVSACAAKGKGVADCAVAIAD